MTDNKDNQNENNQNEDKQRKERQGDYRPDNQSGLEREERHLRRMRLDYIGVLVACLIGISIAGFLKLSESKPVAQPAAVTGPSGWLLTAPVFDEKSQLRACMRVRSVGAAPVYVKFYNQITPQASGSLLSLQIIRGRKQSAGEDCRGFRPDKISYIGAGPGVIWQDGLSALPGLTSNGILDPSFTAKKIWRPGESHDYMVTIYPRTGKIDAIADLRFRLIAGPRLVNRIGEPLKAAMIGASSVARAPADKVARCQKIIRPQGVANPWLQQVVPFSDKVQISVGGDSLGKEFQLLVYGEDDISKGYLAKVYGEVSVNGKIFALDNLKRRVAAEAFVAGDNQITFRISDGKVNKKATFPLKLKIDGAGNCQLTSAAG